MMPQRGFQRKIVYLVAIAALLLPLSWFSQPATIKSEGGQLAQLRRASNLSQADLGKIDPTSASMKLATFGLHGIATNVLWSRAIDYKEREDFTNFDSTLRQITYLQPHFVNVWDYQAHNVSFNISVEFDDYRDRYHYVTKGFNLLKKGIRYNENNPKLLRTLAGYIGIKIGRSDEKKLYRKLFRSDEDFHAPPRDQDWLVGTRYEHRPQTYRDCWLVSKWWYQQAEELVRSGIANYGMTYPVVFHSDAPRQQMQYADNLEADGIFGDKVIQEWSKGGEEWYDFGLIAVPTSEGFLIRLIDFEKYEKQRKKLRDDLLGIEPGLEERLRQEVLDELTPDERAAYEKPAAERTPKEASLADDIEARLRISPQQLAEAVSADRRDEALRLAERLAYAELRFSRIQAGRQAVNFDYWKRRCEIEKLEETMRARQAIFEAKAHYRRSELHQSREKFEEAIALWKDVLDQYPIMLEEETFVDDLVEMIQDGYGVVLAQTNEDGSDKLPEDFALQIVLDRWEQNAQGQ